MGKHRKRRHAPHRTGRRLALVSLGLIIPLSGGAAVFAATGHAGRPSRPSALSRAEHRRSAGRSGPMSAARPDPVRPSASPSPSSASPAATLTPAASGPKIGFSPYADVLAWPPLDLPKTADTTHVKDFTMGFVDAGVGCSPAWGGLTSLNDTFAERRVKSVPGRVTVSFGGPHGNELAQACTDVDDLTAAYEDTLKATKADEIDFYLGDQALADDAAVKRRTQALTNLRKAHPDLPISITLPAGASGLSDPALGALRTALSSRLSVSIVNLVAATGSGQSLIDAATAAHAQLLRFYGQDDAQTWAHTGITPVIGVNGKGKGFQPADAEQVLAWAKTKSLGRLSMWSITRDARCTIDTTAANDTCSGLDEDTGAFAKVFERF